MLGFEEQIDRAHQNSRIVGSVQVEGETLGPLVVILGRLPEPGGDELIGVDSFIRLRPGRYAFAVSPGRYQVGVYEDRNDNGLVDPGERTRPARNGPVVSVRPGQTGRDDIVLGADATTPPELVAPTDVLGLVTRTPSAQREFSLWALSVRGKVIDDLSEETFGPAAGPRGLWEVMDFLTDGIAGIYFLEPYAPDRVPVLFVHGISGYPQEFATLIDSLDRRRFQPWFYFYPSGFALDGVSDHLSTLLTRLEVEHGFDALAVVAHSMGGLVSRGAILKYAAETGRTDVKLFVSISSPWGGDVSAEQVDSAPVELPLSFSDMNPSSDYLRWLFYEDAERTRPRLLPPDVAYHMIFGFRMQGRGGRSSDGTVSVASQARIEAQEQAATVRAFDHGHTQILRSPEIVERVGRLLAQRFE